MRMAGPREAVWHGLIRKNHGCTHIIVGPRPRRPRQELRRRGFLRPYDAQELFREHQDEIGIEMVDFKHMVYVQERAQYEPADEIVDKDASRSSTSRAPSCAAACARVWRSPNGSPSPRW
jgi:sulfate adenylyltransferase